MATNYPNQIDDDTTIPPSINLETYVDAIVANNIRGAIIAVENELGITPSVEYNTVRDRLDDMSSIISRLGSLENVKYNGVIRVQPVRSLNFKGNVNIINTGNDEAEITTYSGTLAAQESIIASSGQTIFTLNNFPAHTSSVQMFINGIKQNYGTDYTVNNSSVIYIGNYIIQSSDRIAFWYFIYGNDPLISDENVITPVPIHERKIVITNNQTIFTLNNLPFSPSKVMMFLNGEKVEISNYYIINRTVYYTGTIINIGDIVEFWYQALIYTNNNLPGNQSLASVLSIDNHTDGYSIAAGLDGYITLDGNVITIGNVIINNLLESDNIILKDNINVPLGNPANNHYTVWTHSDGYLQITDSNGITDIIGKKPLSDVLFTGNETGDNDIILTDTSELITSDTISGNAKDLLITAGNSSDLDGGSVLITAGVSTGTGVSGNIELLSNTNIAAIFSEATATSYASALEDYILILDSNKHISYLDPEVFKESMIVSSLSEVLGVGNTTDGYEIIADTITVDTLGILNDGYVQGDFDIYGDGYAYGDFEIVGKLTVGGLIDPTGLVLDIQNTVPGGTPGADKSCLWINNSGLLILTDEFGTDTALGISRWEEPSLIEEGYIPRAFNGSVIYLSGNTDGDLLTWNNILNTWESRAMSITLLDSNSTGTVDANNANLINVNDGYFEGIHVPNIIGGYDNKLGFFDKYDEAITQPEISGTDQYTILNSIANSLISIGLTSGTVNFGHPKILAHSASTFSPVGLWQFDDDLLNTGSAVSADLSVATGAVIYKKYLGLNGVWFDESTYVSTANSVAALAITGALTIEFIGYLSIDSVVYFISYGIPGLSGGGAESKNTLYALRRYEGVVINWHKGIEETVNTPLYATNFNNLLDNICHCAITRDSAGTALNLYINGELVATATASFATNGGGSADCRFMVGGYATSQYMCWISSLKVIASELSASDILSEYNYCFGSYHGV